MNFMTFEFVLKASAIRQGELASGVTGAADRSEVGVPANQLERVPMSQLKDGVVPVMRRERG
ncbi:hypothetical protein HYW54_04350 [Candidatus Gottesmanbacteria bacterium]|nr:hypothetical protein [Candidatus Gottesmanbacteria bacterium]